MTARAELPAVETSAPLSWKIADTIGPQAVALTVRHWTVDDRLVTTTVHIEEDEGVFRIFNEIGEALTDTDASELIADVERYYRSLHGDRDRPLYRDAT